MTDIAEAARQFGAEILQKRFESKDIGDDVRSAQASLALAQAVVINNAEELAGVAEELKKIKAKAKELTAKRLTMTRPLDESKKTIMDFFRRPLSFLEQAESLLKGAMLTYNRKVQAEARAAAQREEARLKKNAEARARRAEKKGDEDLAEEIRADAEMTVVPVVPESTKVAGVSTRKVWKGEVTDMMALVKAVAAGNAPVTLLTVDKAELGQMARSLKGAVQYPGVRFYSEDSLSSTSK